MWRNFAAIRSSLAMSDRFSDLFKKALADWVTYLQVILEIQDWRIELLGTYPTEDAAASMKCIYGQRVGSLSLAKDFFEFEPHKQRHYLVHELAHVLTDGCDNVIENGLDVILGRSAFTVLREAWVVQIEYLTDQITYIVDELLDGRANHDRLWTNVLRAERDELPIPDPDDRIQT